MLTPISIGKHHYIQGDGGIVIGSYDELTMLAQAFGVSIGYHTSLAGALVEIEKKVNAALPPSPDWFTIPRDGIQIVDDNHDVWSRGEAIGAGYALLVNGVKPVAPAPYPDGWCSRVKIGTGPAPRTVYHENPLGLGWIYWTGASWSTPIPDPEITIPPEPVDSNFVVTGSVDISTNPREVVLSTQEDADKFPQSWINAGQCFIIIPATEGRNGSGPNGYWPERTYATTSAMNADVANQTNFEAHCVVAATGDVYLKWDGVWQWKGGMFGGRWYEKTKIPKALIAKVLSKNGTKLTIDRDCKKSVSGRTCYVDVTAVARAVCANAVNGSTINWNQIFPGASRAPIGDTFALEGKNGVTLECDSEDSFEFFSPGGCPSAAFYMYQCNNCHWKYWKLTGNHGLDYQNWGYSWPTAHASYAWAWSDLGDDNVHAARQMRGVDLILCSLCTVRDCSVNYVNGKAFGTLYSDRCYGYRIKHYNQTHMIYWQWQMMFNDSTNCGTYDCEIHAPGGIPGFEVSYRCQNCFHFRPIGTNASCSFNTSYQCIIGRDPANPGLGGGTITWTAGCLGPVAAADGDRPYINKTHAVVDFSRNSGDLTAPHGGSELNGLVIVILGYTTPENDVPIGVHVASVCPNMAVRNVDYTAPNYAAPSTYNGAQVLWADSPTVKYSGNKCTGTAKNDSVQSRNIYSQYGGDEGGNIVDTHYP